MPQVELSWGVATHVGRRDENQDRCLAVPPLFAVADGMGGHADGAAASTAAVNALAAVVEGPGVGIDSLQKALAAADAEIRTFRTTDPARGAGTTVAGVALLDNGEGPCWAAFHVGDSRIYRWTASSWEQVSTDHSMVQELVDSGEITAAEAAAHPQRNLITRALGTGPSSEADFALLPVEGGERWLVCSDGLSGELDDARIAELVGSDGSPEEVAGRLVTEAVEAGGRDNVSVVLLHVRLAG
ncbi:PP2C family protein-serine/threonine phosphatase [Blastococcus sp. SYSU D00820]